MCVYVCETQREKKVIVVVHAVAVTVFKCNGMSKFYPAF